MENHNVKRGRGRPPKYATEEERRQATRESKTRYMLNKEWYCTECNNNKNYTLAGKTCHIRTQKHNTQQAINIIHQLGWGGRLINN